MSFLTLLRHILAAPQTGAAGVPTVVVVVVVLLVRQLRCGQVALQARLPRLKFGLTIGGLAPSGARPPAAR